MRLMNSVLLFITVTSLLCACGYEELTAEKKRTLSVASDYLMESDSVLFLDFTQKTGVKVKIIPLELDSIYRKVLSDPLNAGFDMIMVSDVRILKNLESKKLLQKFSDELDSAQGNRFFLHTGIDPLVYYANRNLNKDSISYTDLSKSFWFSSLDEIPLNKLFNCIKKNNKWSSRESALWLHRVEQKKIAFLAVDSLAPSMFNVGFLSQFERKKQLKDSLNDFQNLFFPDQTQTGLLYNFYGSGIVYQSSNFSAAMDLLRYLSEVSNAQMVNDKIGIVSYDRRANWGVFKNNRLKLSPKTINDFLFDSKWWNDHMNFARTMKIVEKKPVSAVNPIPDTLKSEN